MNCLMLVCVQDINDYVLQCVSVGTAKRPLTLVSTPMLYATFRYDEESAVKRALAREAREERKQ